MRIIAQKALKDFWSQRGRGDAEQAVKSWYSFAKAATWQTPAEVKADYVNASIVANNRVVFNVAGNKYRLVAEINYEAGIIFIRFIGTHKDYDQIDVTTVRHY